MKEQDLYYIGYPTAEGVYVCVVNDKEQISAITVVNESLNDWNKTDFTNGELLGYSENGTNWYLCVFPHKHEAMNNYVIFQKAHKAKLIDLDKKIKVISVQETLKLFPTISK